MTTTPQGPTSTFLNLPHDRRTAFIESALDEFGQNPYKTASISAVTSRLHMAKGSFYQYFANKADLYLWLLAEAGRKKAEHFAPLEERPIPELVEYLFAEGMRFWRNEPAWARLAERAMDLTGDPDIDSSISNLRIQGTTFWEQKLLEAQQRGELNPTLEPGMVAPLVNALLTTGVADACRRNRLGDNNRLESSDDTIDRLAKTAATLLRSGLYAAAS